MTSFNNATSQLLSALPEQSSILNIFFPGLAPISSMILPLLNGASNIYSRILLTCAFFFFTGKYVWEYLTRLLNNHFSCRVEIPYHDELFEMVTLWIGDQPSARSARSFLAAVGRIGSFFLGDARDHNDKKVLHYSPCNEPLSFWYNGRRFVFRRIRTTQQYGYAKEEVSITCWGRDPKVLKELLATCRKAYLDQHKNKTCIFEHEGDRWRPSKAKSKRDISTVVVDAKLKEQILTDVQEFLDTRDDYSKLSLPYQRGYLLYGPPGTGKTSFSFSITGYFDLDLYVVNLSSVDGQSLKTLFADLPAHCVVLLEDVDAVGLSRKQNSGKHANRNASPEKSINKKLDLSTLLNVLDGMSSPDGRIVIMTTNHIEQLDSALIRAGRVDMKLEFQLANKDMIRRLFHIMYCVDKKKTQCKEEEGIRCEAEDGCRKWHELEEDFVNKLPDKTFSPAEIVSYLVANKSSPQKAFKDADAWMGKLEEDRKKIARLNSWTLGVSEDDDDVNDASNN